jgi:hypothetical protein
MWQLAMPCIELDHADSFKQIDCITYSYACILVHTLCIRAVDCVCNLMFPQFLELLLACRGEKKQAFLLSWFASTTGAAACWCCSGVLSLPIVEEERIFRCCFHEEHKEKKGEKTHSFLVFAGLSTNSMWRILSYK